MELTNHTYLRSRVDMHIADSLRQKASSKIASGGQGDARDNAGGFSAAVRMKSNQYMLQSKRVNIQNSLTFLQAQRDVLNQARDVMDKIGVLKLKFEDPTLNDSDKANINTEFKKLALDLYNLRSQKFNGMPLMAESEEASSVMYGGKERGLPSGTGTEGTDASITLHGIDYQDIDSVYKAGEAVRRGLGGLDYVNFADQEVRQQEELITVSGGIAEGDTFTFYLNQKTQIGETLNTLDNNIGGTGSPHLITYTATEDDENSADPHAAVAAGLKTQIDGLLGVTPEGAPIAFVAAEVQADAANSRAFLTVKSTNAGVPFELFGETSTGSSGEIIIAETSGVGALPAFAENDAEERTYELDLKDDDGKNSGYVLNGNDRVSIAVDGQTISFAPSQAEINADGTVLGIDFSDPLNFQASTEYMLNGLMAAINAEADTNANFKVRATSVDTLTNAAGNDVARITLKSTHRGDPLTGLTAGSTPALSFNFAGNEQSESGSEVSITSSRVAEAGDQVRIRRFVQGFGEDTAARLTFTQGDAGENGFTTFADLANKINNHSSDMYQASITGNTIKIIDKNPESIAGMANPADTNNADGTDRAQRVTLTVTQGQTDYVTGIVPSAGTTLFADKGDTFTDRATGKVGGGSTNGLNVDFNITKATGVVDTASLAVGSNAGLGMAIGDQFTVAGTELGDTDGNSITFRVDSVAGKAATASSVGAQKGKVASDNYTNTGIATTGGGNNDFTLDITSQDDGTITKAQTSISAGGTGYSINDTLSISAVDLGGGNAVAGQITVTEVDGGAVGGPGVITNYTWNSGSARSDNLATTYNAVTTTKVGGAGDDNLTLNISTNASGTITGATVNASGLNYAIGDTVEVTAASLGTTGANRTFTVSGINGEVTGFSHVSGQAQSNWTVTGTENSFSGSGLQITASAGRDGVLTVDSIDNGGSGYSVGTNRDIDLTGDGVTVNNKDFDITSIQQNLSDAKTTNLNSGGTTTTDAERGDQFIAEGGNSASPQASDDVSFAEVATAAVNNVVGENRVRTVTINADKKIGGTGNDEDRIHVGDVFSITVTEELHSDEEASGGWPEGNTNANTFGENPGRTAHEITVSVTAVAGDDENSIATKLESAYNTQRIADVTLNALAGDDLPTVAVSGNTLTFTSGREGEDFKVEWNNLQNPDVITATGAVNDPSGSQSHVGNISPFSITKSLNYFTEMLSQNAAETNRLMRAQEHLEDSIVNTEQAWGKMTDTDYAQASTEQVRASMKMEMANSIIGKSIRMNDLLVDLTTKHHRGAILNASV